MPAFDAGNRHNDVSCPSCLIISNYSINSDSIVSKFLPEIVETLVDIIPVIIIYSIGVIDEYLWILSNISLSCKPHFTAKQKRRSGQGSPDRPWHQRAIALARIRFAMTRYSGLQMCWCKFFGVLRVVAETLKITPPWHSIHNNFIKISLKNKLDECNATRT
jgi:hypothetical protein